MEAKLFLDKISYFNGSNNKEAHNYLAQCKEAAEKMKAPETTVAWSKLAGGADVVMREESRQHEGSHLGSISEHAYRTLLPYPKQEKSHQAAKQTTAGST